VGLKLQIEQFFKTSNMKKLKKKRDDVKNEKDFVFVCVGGGGL
jgi:hypothetical protein